MDPVLALVALALALALLGLAALRVGVDSRDAGGGRRPWW